MKQQEKYSHHIPVLKNEVIGFFQPKAGEIFIDCTFGAGGHTQAILECGAKVIAVDRDENNKKFANELEKIYGENIVFVNDRFSNLKDILEKFYFNNNENRKLKLKGILYDFGVSSMQIDEAERGFSFQKDGALDMRMGHNSTNAYDIVNKSSERELADLIFQYGDEKFARKIAKEICKKRELKPINSTLELADLIKKCCHFYHDKIHPATRTFQAIRIAVNDELGEIKKSLEIASTSLPVECRIGCITFHSLEDEIVKKTFQKYSKGEIQHFNRNDPRILASNSYLSSITLQVITKKPIIPTEEEIKKNVRSRSAKLRVAERI